MYTASVTTQPRSGKDFKTAMVPVIQPVELLALWGAEQDRQMPGNTEGFHTAFGTGQLSPREISMESRL